MGHIPFKIIKHQVSRFTKTSKGF
ncbi:unknown protein [Parachlamydia acanthamoebae UV-7]|uniref:Uncharacterized protein n=1 Tax=Parachlamydia acanthamoebae (strain UV7) TaxID=765952 RepID=F8KVH4_PARAV|nr:unknown protein [Parachlamydia acanthamoebae UV-7]